jgi:hypothetical protein
MRPCRGLQTKLVAQDCFRAVASQNQVDSISETLIALLADYILQNEIVRGVHLECAKGFVYGVFAGERMSRGAAVDTRGR